VPELPRFVADTNVLISRLFFRHSIPAQAMQLAMAHYQLIVSHDTLIELEEVLSRSKFDRYLTRTERMQFLYKLCGSAVLVADVPVITACRDPKDDKFSLISN